MSTRIIRAACLLLMSLTLSAASDLRLIQAVKSEDVEQVRALLKQGVDVNSAQGDGATALHWAANGDHLGIADLLLRAKAKANAANDLGATPLHVACINRNSAMVEKLLEAGAHANAKLLNGETVLMTCARTGDAKAVKALLVHGADPKAKEPAHDQTALMWAAAQSHPETAALLVEFGADVKARSRSYSQTVVGEQTQRAGREELNYNVMKGGSTPLLFAARAGDVESIKILLAAGADANDALPDGTGALVLAAQSGHTKAAMALLDKGAKPNQLSSGYTALHTAVLRSDLVLVKALLAQGADPDLRMTKGQPVRRDTTDFNLLAPLIGSTPYLLAAKFLEPEIMKTLAAGGADTKLTMPDGANSLMLAAGMDTGAEESRRGIATIDFGKIEPESEVLTTVKTAFELSGEVNAGNKNGDTALHAASAQGWENVVQFLVDHGAQINARNALGQTPLALVLSPGRSGRARKPVVAYSASTTSDSAGKTPGELMHLRMVELLRRLGATE